MKVNLFQNVNHTPGHHKKTILQHKIFCMETTVRHTIMPSYTETHYRYSLWKQFITWAKGQEENRLMWLAVAISGHGCIITIMTMLAIIFSGNHFVFWPFAIAAMSITVVSNLAALPTRITIPIFFISILIDVAIIIGCIVIGFDSTGVYR